MGYDLTPDARPIILPYEGKEPVIAEDAFIAPGAVIVGDVTIGSGSSIWFGCVLRADEAPIRIGSNSNLQDGTIIHVHGEKQGTIIGDEVTVGHMVLLHACSLKDRAYVGMGAQILDEAVVEGGGMLAAGALLTPGKTVPSGELWGGRPAALMREITKEHQAQLSRTPSNYAEKARRFMAGLC